MNQGQKRERLRLFEEQCREHGLAVTVQRRRVVEAIIDRKDHPTADQVYERHRGVAAQCLAYHCLSRAGDAGRDRRDYQGILARRGNKV